MEIQSTTAPLRRSSETHHKANQIDVREMDSLIPRKFWTKGLSRSSREGPSAMNHEVKTAERGRHFLETRARFARRR